MKNNVLYYRQVSKSGKVKYTPCQVLCEPESMYTGLYYVSTDIPGVKSTTSCQYLGQIYRVGSPKIIDLEEISGLSNLTEKVIHHSDMRELLNKSHSIHDVIAKTIAIINDLNKHKNDQK